MILPNVLVLGAGSFGTCLSQHLATKRASMLLVGKWMHQLLMILTISMRIQVLS